MKKTISILLAFAAISAIFTATPLKADAATIKGDLNGDNTITLRDASIAQIIVMELIEPTDEQSYSADFNSDGKISLVDASLIQKYSIGDATILNQYAPYQTARTSLTDMINNARIEQGLPALETNDATMAAGNIRAAEVLNGYIVKRPDGTQFQTIFDECNLTYTKGYATEVNIKDTKNPQQLFEIFKTNYPDEYNKLVSSTTYKTLCIGAVQSGRNTYQWVILFG